MPNSLKKRWVQNAGLRKSYDTKRLAPILPRDLLLLTGVPRCGRDEWAGLAHISSPLMHLQ